MEVQMPSTLVGLERARELRRIGEQLDAYAQELDARTRHARENLPEAAHTLAAWLATAEQIEEVLGSEIPEVSKVRLAQRQERYTALAVDAEIGDQALARANEARDVIREELLNVV